MLDFEESLSRSSKQFNEVVYPELQDILKGEFEVVEGITIDRMAKLLDTLAGIDVWHINKLRGIRGIALRIQTGNKNWHTFTIRKSRESGVKTELEKRRYAIENNQLYPYLTVQAYMTPSDKLLAFAIARTVDIIEMIDNGDCKLRRTGPKQIGQAKFCVVDWYNMQEKGYLVKVVNKSKEVA